MLLAIESTEVAEENQNGWGPKQATSVEDFALNCHEVEVKIDPAPDHHAIRSPSICDRDHKDRQ
jgi:hypothetical protein